MQTGEAGIIPNGSGLELFVTGGVLRVDSRVEVGYVEMVRSYPRCCMGATGAGVQGIEP